MPTAANGGAVKAQSSSRDSALTWEVPPSLDEPARDARAAEFELAYRYVARLHVSKLVEQLLAAEGVVSPEAWASILPDLAREAADLLSPTAMHSAGCSDPREVIQIKRSLVSNVGVEEQPEISGCVVDGVVCRGSLAHKRMRSLIENPRIVTLAGVLEYERPYDKLSSFDALMDTERQHLRAKVEAVMAAQPDVVLVEGAVARHAQELLLEAGVSLVTHVEPKLLQSIARCVGSAVQAVGGAPLALDSVGTCEEFEVRWSAEPEDTTIEVVENNTVDNAVEAAVAPTPPPPLIFFRGCKRGLGSSIVLEGTNEDELAKVKRVAASAAYAAYWNRLEIEFLTTQLLAVAACEGPLQDVGQRWLGRTAAGASATQAENRRAKEIQGVRTINQPIVSPSPHISAYEEPGKGSRESDVSRPGFTEAQALWLSISCRNPAKAIVCETPHLHSMLYYAEGDMALADFLSAAAPANRKCPHPSCGDGAALHLRSFMHGDSLVTLSSFHMAPEQELEGANEGKLWFWLRPIGVAVGQAPLPRTHRVALPPEAACMSFAHLLALLLDARDMQVEGVDLQHGFVRYLGLGNSIICLHHTKISPYTVRMPPPVVHVGPEEQAKWLGEEVKELVEEADEVFSVIQENLSRPLTHLQPEAIEECGEVLASLRESYMTMVLKVQAATAQDLEVLPTINKLRRYLMLVAQQWDSMLAQSGTAFAAAATAAATRVTDAPEGLTGDQAIAAQHARTDSSSSSVRQEDQLRASVPSIRFLAPKLVDTEYDTAPGELVSQGEVIPTGLVARYVSLFEDVEQGSKDSGSPRNSSAAVVDEEDRDASSAPWDRAYRRPSTTIDLRRVGTEEAFSPVRSADKLLPEDLDGKLEDLRGQLERLRCTSEETAEGGTRSAAASVSQLAQKLVKGRPLLPNGPDEAPLTIYDNEPSSVVAYFLSTREYHEYVEEAAETCLDSVADNAPKEEEKASEKGDARILCTSLQLDCQMLAEDILPLPYNNRARFSMTAYYAPHFAALRRTCIKGGEAAFLASIARCRPWSVQGGKSNVFFAKTRDDRYVIKQLTRIEKQSILAFAPDYFKYVHGVLTAEGITCLSKIFGVYQVSVESNGAKALPGTKDGTIDFLVMENLFHGCEIDAIYDLKGSVRDRYANGSQSKGSLVVLLDENLRELNQASPTLLSPLAFARLQQSLSDDTNFLASLDVMDYSLLVGFDKTRRELVVGLVDFVRQYTWDKQVESWVKQSGLLGGAGKEPTIISPRQYAKRFRSAMLSYFTVVPLLGEPLSVEEE